MYEIIGLSLLITLISLIGGYIIYTQFKDLKKQNADIEKDIVKVVSEHNNLSDKIDTNINNTLSLDAKIINNANNFRHYTTKSDFDKEKLNVYTKLGSGHFTQLSNKNLKWCPNNSNANEDCQIIVSHNNSDTINQLNQSVFTGITTIFELFLKGLSSALSFTIYSNNYIDPTDITQDIIIYS